MNYTTLYLEQAKGLIEYFMSNPTTQNIRIEAKVSAKYPEITVCPGVTWNYTALKLHNLELNEAHGIIWSDSVQKLLSMSFLEALDHFSLKDFPRLVGDCTIYPLKCIPYNTDWTWMNGSRVIETEGKSCKYSIILIFFQIKHGHPYEHFLAGYWRETRILDSPYDWPLKVCYSFRAKETLRMELPSTSSVINLLLDFQDFDPEYITKRSFAAYYEIRIDSQDDPFTAVRNVTSSGQTFFLTNGNSYMLSLSLKHYNFLPLGGKCNEDENYDYQKVIGVNHLIVEFRPIF